MADTDIAPESESISISASELRKQRREAATPNPAPVYDEAGDVVPETDTSEQNPTA